MYNKPLRFVFASNDLNEIMELPYSCIANSLNNSPGVSFDCNSNEHLLTAKFRKRFLGDSWEEFATAYYVKGDKHTARSVWNRVFNSYLETCKGIATTLKENPWRYKDPGGQNFGKLNPIVTKPQEWYGNEYKKVIVGINDERYKTLLICIDRVFEHKLEFPRELIILIMDNWLLAESNASKDKLYSFLSDHKKEPKIIPEDYFSPIKYDLRYHTPTITDFSPTSYDLSFPSLKDYINSPFPLPRIPVNLPVPIGNPRIGNPLPVPTGNPQIIIPPVPMFVPRIGGSSPVATGIPRANNFPIPTSIPRANNFPIPTGIPQIGSDLPVATGIPQIGSDLPVATRIPQIGSSLPVANGIPRIGNGLPVATGIPRINNLPIPTGIPQINNNPPIPTGIPRANNNLPVPMGIPRANNNLPVSTGIPRINNPTVPTSIVIPRINNNSK